MANANLIYTSYPVEMASYKILKSSPKIYIADATLRDSILMDDPVLKTQSEMSRVVEASVYKHVNEILGSRSRVGYYRGESRGRGIDIVAGDPENGYILIEVKYFDDAQIDERDVIYEYSAQNARAIVVTKNAHDYGVKKTPSGNSITRIPAFAFLYLLGVTPTLF
jgi:predicted AAA+ superfamily ATPase